MMGCKNDSDYRLKVIYGLTILWVCVILICFALPACVPTKTFNMHLHPSQLFYPPIVFAPPKPEKALLPNGMVLYLMEDSEIPLITINAMIRTGGIYEPDDKVGLAQITGEVMRTGGTKTLSSEELDRKLEYMGAIVETGIGLESGSAYMSALKKDLNETLAIFSDILRYPVFETQKVDLAKMKTIESIRRQNDEPMRIASREFKRRVYKADPRGRVSTIEGVGRITRQDLIEFHNSYYFPNNIIMGICGDFKKDEMIQIISKYFGDWDKKAESVPPAPIPSQGFDASVIYAKRPLPQSTILLGHLCCPKNSPDFFPMEILDFILGSGGFNSRLMKEIRSNRGLAYSVGSFYRGAIDYGVFGAYAMTKSETTGQVIDLILGEINRIIYEGIRDDELTWARDSILNQFIFSFESTYGLVKSYISLEYNKLPEDYLETYPEKISSVSVADVNRVARKYLKPGAASIVVVGDSKGFDKNLEAFGKVEEADLSIH